MIVALQDGWWLTCYETSVWMKIAAMFNKPIPEHQYAFVGWVHNSFVAIMIMSILVVGVTPPDTSGSDIITCTITICWRYLDGRYGNITGR